MDGDSGDDDDATVMVMVLARRMGLVFHSGRGVACPSTPASAQAPDRALMQKGPLQCTAPIQLLPTSLEAEHRLLTKC